MKDLLKADFKYLFFRKIPIIFMIFYSIFAAFIGYWSKFSFDGEFGIFEYLQFMILIYLFFVVVLSVDISKEFKNGTIRNKINSGHSRLQIYFSKVTVGLIYTLFGCALFLLIAYISCRIYGSIYSQTNLAFLSLVMSFIGVSFFNVGLVLFLNFLVKNEYGMAIPIVMLFAMFLTYTVLEMSFDKLVKIIEPYTPFSLAMNGYFGYEDEDWPTIVRSLIACAEGIFMIISGYLIFRKSDIN